MITNNGDCHMCGKKLDRYAMHFWWICDDCFPQWDIERTERTLIQLVEIGASQREIDRIAARLKRLIEENKKVL